ncbi:MAG TPA: glycosyltransferase family 4 protein [Firmicutes bacterium]|nr:glycosyltransferase family 4 protein [Bacillota bacterium]
MRVLMLSRFQYSRTMNHIFSLAAALNRQGITAAVIITGCPEAYRDPLRRYHRLFPVFAESQPAEIARLARRYRPELLHLHALPSGDTLPRLLRSLPIPWGITLHERWDPAEGFAALPAPSFLITSHPAATGVPESLRPRTYFIPEGIDLEEYHPLEKRGFKVTLILDQVNAEEETSAALLKAAALADIEVELISPRPLPLLKGRFHGWPLGFPAPLGESQIVIGRRRALLEGMACGNAVLIAGRGYGGIFKPQQHPASLPFPDLSGEMDEPACYRSIFFDLSTLLKERSLLRSLQQQSRKFVRENCNLRLTAEQTGRLYREIVRRQNRGPAPRELGATAAFDLK